MKLRPTKILLLLYECPHCGVDCEVSHDTVSKIGRECCWGCGEVLEFVPISLGPRAPEKPKKDRSSPTVSNHIKDIQQSQDLVIALVGLGYKKGDAGVAVKTGIQKGWDVDDPATFITKVLSN